MKYNTPCIHDHGKHGVNISRSSMIFILFGSHLTVALHFMFLQEVFDAIIDYIPLRGYPQVTYEGQEDPLRPIWAGSAYLNHLSLNKNTIKLV